VSTFATFKQIRPWPAVDGWYVDPETGLRALVNTRIGTDHPITAGDHFYVSNGFSAGDDFRAVPAF